MPQFLVEDPKTQALTISIRDSHITGRPDVGYVRLALSQMPADGKMEAWLPVQARFPCFSSFVPVACFRLDTPGSIASTRG